MWSSSCWHVFLYIRGQVQPHDSSHFQAIRQPVNTNYIRFHPKNEKALFIFKKSKSSWKVDRRLVGSDFNLRSGARLDLISAYRKCSPGEIHQHLWVSAAGRVVSPFSRSVSGCDVTNCDAKTRTINVKTTALLQGKRCCAVRAAKGFKFVLKFKMWPIKHIQKPSV